MDIFRIVYPPLLSEDKSLKSIPEYYKKIRISSSEIYELEKYAPNASLSEINSEILIKLYHDYDRFETFIKFAPNWRINSVKSLLSKIEECSIPNKIKSLYIEEIIESNMDSFGNIMIDILNFQAGSSSSFSQIVNSFKTQIKPMIELIFNKLVMIDEENIKLTYQSINDAQKSDLFEKAFNRTFDEFHRHDQDYDSCKNVNINNIWLFIFIFWLFI